MCILFCLSSFCVLCPLFLKKLQIIYNINLIKIISLTCSLLCDMWGDLTRLHYGSCASDPIYYPMKKIIAKICKCYKQSDLPKHIFIISLYIHHIRSLTCNPLWGFFRSSISVKESKGEI